MSVENYQLNLPYIGTEKTVHGYIRAQIGNHEEWTLYPFRPLYSEFKSKVYNAEDDCVSVLVGVVRPNGIYKFYMEKEQELGELYYQKSDDEWITKLHDDPRQDFALKINHLFMEIQKMIRQGLASGEIGVCLQDEPFQELEENDLFRDDRYFHSLSFLKWMQRNGFPIPDELRFHENKQGQLEYVDPVIYGELERSFPKHPTGKEKIMDPLYVAMKAREALIGLIGGNNTNPRNYGARDWLDDWIEKNYPKIPKRQRPHIISIVNDGYGRGKGKI